MTWVLLPGMDGTGELIAPFKEALPKDDTAVVVRYPRARILSKRELFNLIDEALPITGEYVLVAESFSGPLALEIASRDPAPKRLRALILCASFSRSPVGWFESIFAPIALRMPFFNFAIRYFLVGSNASAEEVSAVRESIESVGRDVLVSRFDILRQVDCANSLAGIKTPTLILGATGDKLVSKELTLEMANGIPGARLCWIDGPHLLLWSKSKEILPAVENFLASS